jgi:predicted AlkP superfamily phosphohydrolase/phosphomutase
VPVRGLGVFLVLSLLFALSGESPLPAARASGPRVIVLGFDGADPDLAVRFMDQGKLPNLAKLRAQGSFLTLGTTRPAESPVAWSSFATGMNPGKHRIFDFLTRVPNTYLPDIALAKESTQAILPETSLRVALALGIGGGGFALVFLIVGILLRARRGRALAASGVVGLLVFGACLYAVMKWLPREIPMPLATREGVAFWKYTSQNGIRTVALEAPVTFPAEEMPGGKLLTGLGTPDLLKTWGTWTLYTSDLFEEEPSEMGGLKVPLDFEDGVARSTVRGPKNFTVPGKSQPDIRIPMQFKLNPEQGSVSIEVEGRSLTLNAGEWSDWVELGFPINPLITLHGMTRFCVLSTEPNVQVYAEPINWNPKKLPPTVHISYPHRYAGELARAVGLYETIGWSTATNPLKDEAIGYDAFTQDVDFVRDNQRRMLLHELGQKDWQCLVGIFLFTDRVQHMVWRFEDPGHPLYDAELAKKYGGLIEKAYRDMDAIVGEVMERYLDPDTTLFVLSDHGFHSFRKGVNVNTWLVEKGYMTLSGQLESRQLRDLFDSQSRLFSNVDWSRTKAYALGLSGIYINVAGREPKGIVAPGAEYESVKKEIAAELLKLTDPETGERVVRSVSRREDVFHGPFTEEAYDLEIGFESGYRTSWQTSLGGTPPEVIELNKNNWSGDHCSVDADLTGGLIFSNRKILREAPRLIDVAPTILKLFGIPVPGDMDGEPIL